MFTASAAEIIFYFNFGRANGWGSWQEFMGEGVTSSHLEGKHTQGRKECAAIIRFLRNSSEVLAIGLDEQF
jgi:hypothetical protein